MDYDVLILGGGIIGCAVAYELSKYSLNIALIEKDYDIADDVAAINSAIVYDGMECNDTLMAKLEFMGNNMFDEITDKFNIPFKRVGSLMIAEGKNSEVQIEEMYKRAIKRGIEYIELLDANKVYELEPNLNCKVTKALYSKNTAIVCPYDLAIAFGEVAFDNGVNFRLAEEVIDIQKVSRGVRVVTNKNKFTCKMVINTTPVENFSIDMGKKVSEDKRKFLNYLLLEEGFKGAPSNIVFLFRENGDKIYSYKNLNGNTLAAFNTDDIANFEETSNKVSMLLNGITDDIVDSFYQSNFEEDTIIIDDSFIGKGYLKVIGKHYGQVAMTPSIAKMICETIVQNLNCKLKREYNDRRRDVFKFRDLNNEERNKIIKMDSRYGKVVCLCQLVTEGEIIDCIRRPLGARTVEGVKRRTGATLGNCKGAYCTNKIVSILARETNKSMTDIVKDSKKSNVLRSRIKEFDDI
jgi:L-2-hydroxyglutarate oxidase LhgO/bacterioferritin-associated ferredoxin